MLLARARWLFGAIDDIKAEVRTGNREPSGTVRLGVPSSPAEILYAPLARLFVETFSAGAARIERRPYRRTSDRLLRGELDLAVVTTPLPNDHLAYETLVVEQVYVIGPPRDPLLKRGRLTRKKFNGLPAAVAAVQPQSVPVDRALLPTSRQQHADEKDRGFRPRLRLAAIFRHSRRDRGRYPVGSAGAMDSRRSCPGTTARSPGQSRHA